MPRPAKIWARKNRPGFYATIGKQKVFLGLDRAHAEREFHRLKAATKPIPRSKQRVDTLVDLYLDHASREVRESTFINYKWFLQSWCDHAGSRIASELKPLDVAAWVAGQQWNPTTRHQAISIAIRWSRWCKRMGHLDRHVLEDTPRPKQLVREAAPPEEIDQLLAAIPDQQLRDIATVIFDSGARPGEIRTLTAAQINWEARSAVVTGKRGSRIISLTERSIAILERCAITVKDGPLLLNMEGRPWSKTMLPKRFNRLCKRLGIHVVPYMLRHDLYRRASKAGASDLAIAKQLGHADLKMLAAHYAHIDTTQTRDVVDAAAAKPREPKSDDP
jgi:integrase